VKSEEFLHGEEVELGVFVGVKGGTSASSLSYKNDLK